MMDDPMNRPRNEDEVAELLRSIDVAAPAHLHERVDAMLAEHRRPAARASRSGVAFGALRLRLGAAGIAVAALAVALVLAVSGSGGGGPGLSLQQASAVTLRAATLPPPAESSSQKEQLAASVDGVSFPYWGERFGWHSQGSREDRIGGRTIRTVFYSDGTGRRVGYAIVAGTPAPHVSGGAVAWRGGTAYRLHSVDGTEVVTWTRDGHLCVVSGRGVQGRTLLALASWNERPATT